MNNNQSANNEPQDPISYRPDLPDWGAYLRWPTDGDAWLHEEDRAAASELIPSSRVWRRERWDGEHFWLHYGEQVIRVRPTLWVSVPPVDLEVEQQVELLARHGEHDPGIFQVAEVLFNARKKQVEFCLQRDAMQLEQRFLREALRPIHVRHQLRAGFYQHATPTADLPADLELLDVGDLLSDSDASPTTEKRDP